MIGVEIQNRGAFLKMAADAAALDNDIKNAIKQIARDYNAIVASELRRAKSGRVYGAQTGLARFRIVRRRVQLFGGKAGFVTRRERLKSTTSKSYRASRPGEAPAIFTGNLLRGLRIVFPSKEKGYGAKVFSRKGIAGHRHLLEFGTKPRFQKKSGRYTGFVAPRPIWTPMQKRALDDLQRRLLRVIDASAAFRGGGQ
jgi:hypothetical protein